MTIFTFYKYINSIISDPEIGSAIEEILSAPDIKERILKLLKPAEKKEEKPAEGESTPVTQAKLKPAKKELPPFISINPDFSTTWYDEKPTDRWRAPNLRGQNTSAGQLEVLISGLDGIIANSARWIFQMNDANRALFLIIWGTADNKNIRLDYQHGIDTKNFTHNIGRTGRIRFTPEEYLLSWDWHEKKVTFTIRNQHGQIHQAYANISFPFEKIDYLAVGNNARPGRYPIANKNLRIRAVRLSLK